MITISTKTQKTILGALLAIFCQVQEKENVPQNTPGLSLYLPLTPYRIERLMNDANLNNNQKVHFQAIFGTF